jgi:hypothetical protein
VKAGLKTKVSAMPVCWMGNNKVGTNLIISNAVYNNDGWFLAFDHLSYARHGYGSYWDGFNRTIGAWLKFPSRSTLSCSRATT